MTPLKTSAPGQGPTQEQVQQLALDPVKKLLETSIDQDVNPEKTWQYLTAREGLEYWRGNQFGAPALVNGEIQYQADPLNPFGTVPVDDTGDEEIFDDEFNVYRGDGKKFVALVGPKPPNTKAVADNPEDHDSVEAARKADIVIRVNRAGWDDDKLNRRAAKGLWCTGSQFGHTFWEADGDKYGWNFEPVYELQEQVVEPAGYQCPNCGTRTPEDQAGPPLSQLPGDGSAASSLTSQAGAQPPLPPDTLPADAFSGQNPPQPISARSQITPPPSPGGMPAPPAPPAPDGSEMPEPPSPEDIGQQIGMEAAMMPGKDQPAGAQPGQPPQPGQPNQPPQPAGPNLDPLSAGTGAGSPSPLTDPTAPPEPSPDQFLPPATTCQSCGAPLGPETYTPEVTAPSPTQTGTKKYPNGRVRLNVYNVLHVTTPPETNDLESCLWLRLESEEHKADLLSQFPAAAEELKGEYDGGRTADQNQGAMVRRLESSWGTLVERQNRNTRSIYWLSPKMFELIEDPGIKDILKQTFPKGLRVIRLGGDKIVDWKHEKLSEVWSYCTPDISETIWGDPLGKDFIPYQNFLNHAGNMTEETLLRGIPQSFADPSVINIDQLRRRVSRPGELHPATAGSAGILKDAVKEMPRAELSEHLAPTIAAMTQQGRESSGMLSAVWGGSAASTAREAEQNKNQALQVLNIPWDELRNFWEKIDENGVRLFAQYGDKGIAPGGPNYGLTGGFCDVIDAAEIMKEGWHVHADEAFPMTWGQRRDAVQLAFSQGPQSPFLQIMGLNDPFNAPVLQELFGFPGLYSKGVDLQQYVMRRITQLLRAEPIQQPDPMTGQVMLMPSVQPDPFIEKDLGTMAEYYRCWCISKAGERAQRENEKGFENVRAYGMFFDQQLEMQQAQAAMQQAQANQPPAGPSKSKPKPKANPAKGAPVGANVGGGLPGSNFPPPSGSGATGAGNGSDDSNFPPTVAVPGGAPGVTMPPAAGPGGGLPAGNYPLQ